MISEPKANLRNYRNALSCVVEIWATDGKSETVQFGSLHFGSCQLPTDANGLPVAVFELCSCMPAVSARPTAQDGIYHSEKLSLSGVGACSEETGPFDSPPKVSYCSTRTHLVHLLPLRVSLLIWLQKRFRPLVRPSNPDTMKTTALEVNMLRRAAKTVTSMSVDVTSRDVLDVIASHSISDSFVRRYRDVGLTTSGPR